MLYSELVPERIFRFYGVRFQIEFAFRDAMQHLGLNDSQARSQAKLHFRFNICLHCPVLSPPAGPALGAAPPRPRADTPPNPRPVAATSRRNACGCAHFLSKRGRPHPRPAWQYDAGLKMCPNHRTITT